jgi:deoxyribodipyrimidine photolyase-like uncharacterized protein
MPCETLVLVLGDQLSLTSSALDRITSDGDRVLLLEVRDEANYVPQHKIRIVLFSQRCGNFAMNCANVDTMSNTHNSTILKIAARSKTSWGAGCTS